MPTATTTKSKAQSQGVAVDKEKEEKKPRPDLNEHETKALSRIIRRANFARDQREANHREFHGMSYLMDYQANLDASFSFLQPKINRDDVRISTPTSEKKMEAVLNEVLSMNIQHEVGAFDKKNKEIQGLGKDFEHLVTQTNTMEREEDVLIDIYREMLSQRAVFVREVFDERWIHDPSNRKKRRKVRMARKELVSGNKVYLGDINIPAYRFNEQPFYVEYNRVSYDTARSMFIDNENWKYVMPGGKIMVELAQDSLFSWRMHDLESQEVEIVRYVSTIDNEIQIVVNGIMMLKVGTTLTWEHEGYDMAMIVVNPNRGDFAYGKAPIGQGKSLQALENETIRNLVRKFRQAIEPPMVTASKHILSRDIFTAGTTTNGIRKGEVQMLIDNPGVTQSEFQMYDLINKKTEEFTGVSRAFQGLDSPGEKTATQSIKELEQSIKMIGLVVLAAIRLRRDMTYLRIYTILQEFTKPTGPILSKDLSRVVSEFMEFTIDNVTLPDGKRGKKIIKFTDKDTTPEEEQAMFNLEESEADAGRNVRLRTINRKKLMNFPVFWFVTAQKKEREGSALNKIMFKEEIAQAAEIEQASQGQVRTNWAAEAEKMEIIWNSPGLFQKSAPNSLEQPTNAEDEQGAEVKKGAADIVKQLQGISAQRGGPQAGNARQLLEPLTSQTRQKVVAR